MTPDQIQQLMHQELQWGMAATPLWMKALFLLQVLSLLATVICLPLITWKLFSSGKSCRGTPTSPMDDARLREIRAKREALEKMSEVTQPSSAQKTIASREDDSRFRPPQ